MKYSYSLCCILLSSVDAIWVDCKTVGFFLKISKEIGKAWRRSCAQEAREPYTPVASLPSLAFCFQSRSRPFVWLLSRTWIRKNTDCFAVCARSGRVLCFSLNLQCTPTKRHIVRERGFENKTQQPLGFICCVEVIVRYNPKVQRNSFKWI